MSMTVEVSTETCGKCGGSGYMDLDQECLVCIGKGKIRFIAAEPEPEFTWVDHA